MKCVDLVRIMCLKTLKTIYRHTAIRRFLVFSGLFVFGSLWLMFVLSKDCLITSMTSSKYTPLAFDMICSSSHDLNVDFKMECKPNGLNHESDNSITATDVLYNVLTTGNMMSSNTAVNDFANFFGSMLMNGLPILGLDDFVHLSDLVNEHIGISGREKVMKMKSFGDTFGNFFEIRKRELRIAPANEFSTSFVKYLEENCKEYKMLSIVIHDNLEDAMDQCCENVWAVVDMTVPAPKNSANIANIRPQITVRMHPSSIPDTRNRVWSPAHSKMARAQSGQLLYFVSGFLSLQLEFHNWLSSTGLAGIPVSTSVFNKNSPALTWLSRTKQLAEDLLRATDAPEVFQAIVNISSAAQLHKQHVFVPIYNRAFPTHKYEQIAYWHSFESILTIVLIIFASIPAAITTRLYELEKRGGQQDVLCTLPSVMHVHCVLASLMSCAAVSCLFLVISWLYFANVLTLTKSYLPSICLFLLGISLGPIAMLLGLVVNNPDTLVITIPTAVFVLMLPGILYVDLAFDVQRTVWIELVLCCSPPSAAALILRSIMSGEGLRMEVTPFATSPVAATPLYLYFAVLAIDVIVYGWIACVAIVAIQPESYHSRLNSSSNWNYLVGVISSCLCASCRSGYVSVPEGGASHESINLTCLIVNSLCKQYLCKVNVVSILDNVSTKLLRGSVTTLLGSNGAGKSTLLKLLAGLDSAFTGTISFEYADGDHSNANLSKKERIIGWCPQNDPIFEYLTVQEHLDMFSNLINISNGTEDSAALLAEIQQSYEIISSLQLAEHSQKLGVQLSGGMKRRLSLALAWVGRPSLLIMDEPTSGCDCCTREVIRKFILQHKQQCIAVISTHHLDDVEILSDRILFLNNRQLTFDGPFSGLGVTDGQDEGDFTTLQFSTSDLNISEQLRLHFCKQSNLVSVEVVGKLTVCRVPSSQSRHMLTFVESLESQGLTNWSLCSPSAFSLLSNLYSNEQDKIDKSISSEGVRVVSMVPNRKLESSRACQAGFMKQVVTVALMRWKEVAHSWFEFLCVHIFFPFVVACIIATGCRDVQYPRMLLNSAVLQTNATKLSEICLSFGDAVQVSAHKRALEQELSSSSMLLSWRGKDISSRMWAYLFKDFYKHSADRLGAFTISDVVDDWISSSITIDQSSLQMNIKDVYEAISSAQSQLCNSDSIINKHLYESSLCGAQPAYVISLINSTTNSTQALVITTSQSLNSNLTMFTNVTSPHAAPVYLKEYTTMIYGILSNAHSGALTPQYDLYSHPFAEVNNSSQIYLERGYMGAVMIVMFVLLITAKSVRFVTSLQCSGAKLRLHLAGLRFSSFWSSNALCDSILVFASLMSILVAIYMGGDPIRSYFYDFLPYKSVAAVILTGSFACAIVTSGYFYASWTKEQLTCQLVMLVSTMSAIFVKLFCDRHREYDWISLWFYGLSPSYAFTSGFLEMFKWHVIKQSVPVDNEWREQESCQRVLTSCSVLTAQAAVYLALIILSDLYMINVSSYMQKLCWTVVSFIRTLLRLNPWSSSCSTKLTNDHVVSGMRSEASGILRHVKAKIAVGLFPAVNTIINTAAVPSIAASDDNGLVISSLSAKYNNTTDLALTDFWLDSDSQNNRVALLGMNGSGKSTLFKILGLGEIIPSHGRACVDGVDVVTNRLNIVSQQKLGYVPQEGGLLDFLTVSDTVAMIAGISGVRERGGCSLLGEEGEQHVVTLSGGCKKKLSVYLALSYHPSLLMLDEVSTGVDPIAAESIIRHLVNLPRAQALLFTSHRVDECLMLCDKIVLLHKGSQVFTVAVTAFEELASLFYQADVITTGNYHFQLDDVVSTLCSFKPDRIVIYSPTRSRMTFEKCVAPMSKVWQQFNESQREGRILSFSFRVLSMEEAISAIIAATQS